MQRFYFHGKRAKTDSDILQLLDTVETRHIWKHHVTVKCATTTEVKTRNPTRKNPYPHSRVRVFAGRGPGWPGVPQGYP
jgi:hypothetical protein